MKSEQYVKQMLRRTEGKKRKAFSDENDKIYGEMCAVLRTLKIILEVNSGNKR